MPRPPNWPPTSDDICAMSRCIAQRPALAIALANMFGGTGWALRWPQQRRAAAGRVCHRADGRVAAHQAGARSRGSHHGVHDRHVQGLGPQRSARQQLSAREILDKASKEIDTGLSNDPELQAQMMYTMAGTYSGLGLDSRAQPLLERVVEIQRRVLGPENRETLASTSLLASTENHQGYPADGEKLLRKTLDQQRRTLGPEHPDTLLSMSRLADALLFELRHAEAEKEYRETLDLQRRILGPAHPDTLYSMRRLAACCGLNSVTAKPSRSTARCSTSSAILSARSTRRHCAP